MRACAYTLSLSQAYSLSPPLSLPQITAVNTKITALGKQLASAESTLAASRELVAAAESAIAAAEARAQAEAQRVAEAAARQLQLQQQQQARMSQRNQNAPFGNGGNGGRGNLLISQQQQQQQPFLNQQNAGSVAPMFARQNMSANQPAQFSQMVNAGGHMMMMVPQQQQQQQQQQMRMQMAPPFVHGGAPNMMMNAPGGGGGAFMGGGAGQPMFAANMNPNQRAPMMQQPPFMSVPFRVVGGGPSLPLQSAMQQQMMARGPMMPQQQQQQLPPHIMQQLAMRAQRFGGGGGGGGGGSARRAQHGQAASSSAAAPLTTIVRVRHLPVDDEALEATLRAHFEAFGAIAELVIFAPAAATTIGETDAGGIEACVRFALRADAERAMADGGANFGSPSSSSSPSVSASPSSSSSSSSSKQRPLLLAWASSMQPLSSLPSATDDARVDGASTVASGEDGSNGSDQVQSRDQGQGVGDETETQSQSQPPQPSQQDPATMSRAERAYAAALEAAAGDYASEAERVAAAEAAWLAHGGGDNGGDGDGNEAVAAAVGDEADGEQVCVCVRFEHLHFELSVFSAFSTCSQPIWSIYFPPCAILPSLRVASTFLAQAETFRYASDEESDDERQWRR